MKWEMEMARRFLRSLVLFIARHLGAFHAFRPRKRKKLVSMLRHRQVKPQKHE